MTGDNYIDELTVTDPVRENKIDIGKMRDEEENIEIDDEINLSED